jgi:hypothetical protein
MSVEGWVRWCRSRTAWVWTIAAVVPTLLCAWLDRSGSDFYIGLCLVDLGVVALVLRAFRVHVLRTAAPLSGQTQ